MVDIVSMFGDKAFMTLPILLILVVVAFIVGFAYMYKARVLFFKWSRGIEVPCAFNNEGGVPVPIRDTWRKTMEGGRIFYESKEFGDVFDGTTLSSHIRYVKGGRLGRWQTQMLTVFRNNGEWTTAGFEREGGDPKGKVIIKQVFSPEARIAQATMREKNKDFLTSEDFWTKYGGYVALGLVCVVFIVSLIVITQFVGGIISTSQQPLIEATNTLARAINCSAGGALPTPIPPPRG